MINTKKCWHLKEKRCYKITIKGEYVSRPFPWVSKSKIKTYKFCPYCFYLSKILKEKGELGLKTKAGTNTHLIFSNIFRLFDIEYVIENIDLNYTDPIRKNELTNYVYGLCMDQVPKHDRSNQYLRRIFWKFSIYEAGHFYYLYDLFNGNKFKIWEYFKPQGIEEYIEVPQIKIFGTLDRRSITVDKNLNKKTFIADYKTGHIPKESIESGSLPTTFNKELHFYMLLHLIKNEGYRLSEKVVKFLNDDLYYENGQWREFKLGKTKEEDKKLRRAQKKYLTSLGDDYRLFKIDEKGRKKIFPYKNCEAGIIFFTIELEPKNPVVVKRNFSYTSYKAVLNDINYIRKVVKYLDREEYYAVREMKTRPQYSPYKCPHCSMEEYCLAKEEKEMVL